ncbi:MAG: TIGR04255 family protein [Chloroflexi bacterium]|nr:TIGR04255 family protein [Chloroflexota bacterium]
MPQTSYKNPRLIEALCEIHFEPGPAWDSTLFGLFYEKIREAFPEKRELRNVEVSVKADDRELSQYVREAGVRMQFVRQDGTAMVQVAPNLLVVNQLPPYPNWAEFSALIRAHFENYLTIAQPQGMVRIGLRYINRFDFAPAEFDFAALFAHSALIPSAVFEGFKPFLFRLEIAQGEQTQLLFTMGTPAGEAEKVSVVLDLDHVSQVSLQPEAGILMECLNRAHERIEAVFESCLTDNLRQRLNQ